MKKSGYEKNKMFVYTKVGGFFLVGFLIFFVTVLSIRKIPYFRSVYRIVVVFDFVEGIRPASPVRFAGVDIGEIEKVYIVERFGRPLVHVKAKIDRGEKIPDDSSFMINSLSLFGEKYLEIIPSAVIEGYLNDGDTVKGLSPIPLASLFAGFSETMEEVRGFVKGEEIKASLESSLANIEDVTFSLKMILQDMRDERGTVGRLLYDDSLYSATEEFVRDIKRNPWKLLHKPRGQ